MDNPLLIVALVLLGYVIGLAIAIALFVIYGPRVLKWLFKRFDI